MSELLCKNNWFAALMVQKGSVSCHSYIWWRTKQKHLNSNFLHLSDCWIKQQEKTSTIMHLSLVISAAGVLSCFFFIWRKQKKYVKTQNLACCQLVARFSSQLSPAESKMDFPNNLLTAEELLHQTCTGCRAVVTINSFLHGPLHLKFSNAPSFHLLLLWCLQLQSLFQSCMFSVKNYNKHLD